MNDTRLKEYKNLKDEMIGYINLQNSFNTFGIATSITIFTFINEKLPLYPYIYLLPYFIILPIFCRIIRYSKHINKISAYLIVFLEKNDPDIRWGRANIFYYKYNIPTNFFMKNIAYTITNYDFLFIGLLSDFLFYYAYFFTNKKDFFSFIDIIWIILPIIFTLLIFFLIHYQKYMTDEKNLEIDKWNSILDLDLDDVTHK